MYNYDSAEEDLYLSNSDIFLTKLCAKINKRGI